MKKMQCKLKKLDYIYEILLKVELEKFGWML